MLFAFILATLAAFFASAFLVAEAALWSMKVFTNGWWGRLMDRLLRAAFDHTDVCKRIDGELTVYLRRYFIRHSTSKRGGLYLHHIRRSDDDRDPHDHPWRYTSYVLAGGYTEEGWRIERGDRRPQLVTMVWHGPGSRLKRPATWLHRLQIPEGKTCWSFVVTGPRVRDWGFETEGGWVEQAAYKTANAERLS